MPPKRKVVYLSRFFEENVELVANMCVKCYQQEDEVKVTGINRNFSNAIKSRRVELRKKKQKLIAKETDSDGISSDCITRTLDENCEENVSISTDSEESSLDLHDISSSTDTELDEDSSSMLTSASNVSLNDIRSNLDETTDSQSIVDSSSLTNNSCNFIDKFEQTCDTLSNNKDKITDCENTSKIFEHISRDNEATFKSIFKESNNVIENSLQNDDGDDINNIISNNISSSVSVDTSSDCSEDSFNFFQDRQAKIENISAEKIAGTVPSQSIFKTLNSKNSRLYDDFSTNVTSSKNYKHKSILPVNYNVNTGQLTSCAATLTNEDLTSVNNDKQCVSSSQCNEEIVETTKDDSIIELINRIHSPVEFLADNNKINQLKEEINVLQEENVIEETQVYKIVEEKQNLGEIDTTEENILEASIKEEICISQYFSQKSISKVPPQKHFEYSEKETQIVSQFFPSVTNNFTSAEEEPKRKINFSKLRKKIL